MSGNFWSKVKSFFKKLLSKAPGVIEDIQLAIAGLAPIVEAADPGLAPLIAKGVTLVVNGLEELQKLIASYQGAPGAGTLANLQAGFADVQANLGGLLSAAGVKNTALTATITNVIASATQSLAILESSVVAVHPTSTVAPVAAS